MCDPLIEDCPTEEPTGPSMKDLHPIDEEEFTSNQIMAANLQILGAAMTATIFYAWNALRFNVNDNIKLKEFDATWLLSLVKDNNNMKYAALIKDYGGLAIFFIATITQLLNMLGMFGDIN